MVRPIPGEPNKCQVFWLLDCDYNGMIPSHIMEIAMPLAQIQFADCIRKLAKTI